MVYLLLILPFICILMIINNSLKDKLDEKTIYNKDRNIDREHIKFVILIELVSFIIVPLFKKRIKQYRKDAYFENEYWKYKFYINDESYWVIMSDEMKRQAIIVDRYIKMRKIQKNIKKRF
jgi:hypothetical protein